MKRYCSANNESLIKENGPYKTRSTSSPIPGINRPVPMKVSSADLITTATLHKTTEVFAPLVVGVNEVKTVNK